MKTEKINVDGREFNIKELKAIEVDTIDFNDKKVAIKQQVILSTGLNEEEYSNLTWKERMKIVETINKINGLVEDFRQPTK
jgi:hypothetical protein